MSAADETRSDRLLVIIPAFNEEASLPAVLDELYATLPAIDVVVIDDGSLDRTADVARAGGAAALRLPYNLGIGGALRTGFRYGVDHGYRRAVQFDADGQHDPGEVAALVRPLADGADLVIGSRFADAESDYEVGRVRRRAMRVLGITVRVLSGQVFTDTSSGFRAFGPDALDLFARSYPAEYMESVEALVMACASGLRVAEVPVRMRTRAGGQPSTRSFRLAYHYVRLLLVVLVTKRRAPLREATP
ncbi:MAG: glycosyltransferase family 2 protein [Acidimicrobiales bacterium]|nr:glycosyltransferase family 2 protein [Acidimicrobiales bacterium]